MRTIRVKTQNQAAIMAALREHGFLATAVAAPLSAVEDEANDSADLTEWTYQSLDGMSGIRTDASGHQAHKIISALKVQNTYKIVQDSGCAPYEIGDAYNNETVTQVVCLGEVDSPSPHSCGELLWLITTEANG